MYLKHCLVTSNVEYFKGDIQEIIKSHKTIKEWAYILHDKDDTANHYHIYLNFGSSGVDTKQVGEWFGLQESQVEKIKGRKPDALQYLTHSDNKQKYKHQYSPDEVIANFDVGTEITNAKMIGDWEHFSYAEMLNYVHSLPVSERAKAHRQLENDWNCHLEWLSTFSERKVNVMFVCGAGGTGKTYYAKKILKEKNIDFCISSSSNDFMQDYLGQRALILDDCRDNSFRNFEDCLKMLDNDTGSSVHSRFRNKMFIGELIIITSSVPLCRWFRGKDRNGNYFNIENEDLNQLYRRIGCYAEVKEEEIFVYNEIGKDGKPKGVAIVYKNELAEKKKEKKEKFDFLSMFDSVCERATSDVFDIEQMRIKETEKRG